ncbi:GNAT family N-acetyltransferase [Nitrobacter sp.]|uniref:GNAT family N-acetyltransferase n=1 Tax=Nitrobacter sp. TaxID=29420 RepID=UPI0029CAC6A5|nr:GNAT family N-acetyltransferase [Nitrobacter sp.]
MISVNICSPTLDLAAPWDDLVQRASPNVFMNPAALTVANEIGFARVRVLLAWDDSAEPRKLVGIWAFQVRRISRLWPALLEALPYNYAFLSSPVVDPAFVGVVVPAFLSAIRTSPLLPNVINLKSLDAEATSFDMLVKTLTEQGRAQLRLSESTRPFATPELGVKRSGSTRKKLRQDWNRLSAAGAVDIVNNGAPDTAEAFETFLKLEASGWKGARGTALLCDAADAAFVRRMVAALAERGSASVALLRVDGRPIAAQVLMYCGATAYTWKTAFSPDYAKYSPGALLIDKITDELFSAGRITAIDSCSYEGSFMTQLWAGHRKMADLLVDVGPGKSLAFSLEAARQRGYGYLRWLRDWIRAWSMPAAPKSKKVSFAAHR